MIHFAYEVEGLCIVQAGLGLAMSRSRLHCPDPHSHISRAGIAGVSTVPDFAFVFQGFVVAVVVSPFLCKITKQNPTDLLGRMVSEHEKSRLSLPCVFLVCDKYRLCISYLKYVGN